ncbi:MAG: hypothetical protein NXI23_12965 [Bacteroidetes bacterium]|nr:hypothetical protein [Bacteroidota bacterium]MDF1866961.1 hypothetical protein [Saprospiraceae bacterium]
MKKSTILEDKFLNQKLDNSQLSSIKGGDDKRGGFPGTPPVFGIHGGTTIWIW